MSRQERSDLQDGVGSYKLKNGERRYRVVMKVNGRTVSKGGFQTKGAARAWRDLRRADVVKGEWIDPKLGTEKFGTYARKWVDSAELRDTTRSMYRRMLDGRLACWADVPLSRITPSDVRAWVGDMRSETSRATGRPLSRATIVKNYTLLHKVLRVAVADGLIRGNPCNVTFKKEAPKEPYCPTPAEVLRVADAVPRRYRALVLVAGFGGLRWGEAIALTRRHIDLDSMSLDVRQTVAQTADGHLYLQEEGKTPAAHRTVYLPAVVCDALRLHLARYAEPGDDGLLFPAYQRASTESPYLRRENFRRKMWLPALKTAGLPRMRFHDLRHGAATLLAQSGVTTKELMDQIGHVSSAAAMRYQHATDDRRKAIPAKLDALIPTERAEATGTDNVVPIRPGL